MKPNEMAERVRDALLDVALRTYEEAGVQGLCLEGRWEAAVSVIRSLDLTSFSMGGEESQIAK